MEKLYERINFENAPSKKTPLSEENLNKMDEGIDKLDDRTVQFGLELENARIGLNDVIYGNLGNAIRNQLSQHLGMRNKTTYDANDYRETGFVFCGGSENWTNVPKAGGGILVTLSMGADSATAIYQIFISYEGVMYHRNLRISGWNEWKDVINSETNSINFNMKESAELDIDKYTDSGFYFLGSGKEWLHTPVDATKFQGGVLLVLDGNTTTRCYQLIIGYDRTLYLRRHGLSTFSDWVTFSDDSKNVPIGGENNNMLYFIKKATNNLISIYRKCTDGYIGYTYLHMVDDTINVDTWKLHGISICDENRTEISAISAYENEGVLKIYGEADYLGGIHGDEHYTAFTFFVDGKEMTVDDIANGVWCEEIRFLVKSDLFHCNGGAKVFERTKQTTFNHTGIHINNRWKCLESVNLTQVRGGMFSVYKSVATKYYDSVVNTYPMDIPATDGSIYNNNLIDTYYMGDVSVHVWVRERGGDSSMYTSSIQDFEDRLKTYFDCYNNHATFVGEELYCQHSFNIVY